MSPRISYKSKIKSKKLGDFTKTTLENTENEKNRVKEILVNIRHLRADLWIFEAKRNVQLEALKKTSYQIKIVKEKIKVWSDQIASF